jgi:hypothetical protein
LLITFGKLALAANETLSADLLRACLPKRFFKDMCFFSLLQNGQSPLDLEPAGARLYRISDLKFASR